MPKTLSFRNITGEYFKSLEAETNRIWAGRMAAMFDSDQPKESYPFLTAVPALREWLGKRQDVVLSEHVIEAINRKYESGISFEDRELQLDKSTQAMTRVADLGRRAAQLPRKLLSGLLEANGNAYDGIALFGDRSSESTGGGVNNALVNDIGDATVPTSAQFADGILACIERIMDSKDEQGEPMHDDGMTFGVLVPARYMGIASAAINNEFTSAGVSNTLQNMAGLTINLYVEARLATPTTADGRFYVFREDTIFRGLIWQDQVLSEIQTLSFGSDYYVLHDRHFFGVKRIGAGQYGHPGAIARYQFI